MVKEDFQEEVISILTQKVGVGIIHADESTKKVLGRMLSYTEMEMQESRLHFRSFRHFSNEERVNINGT